MNILITGNVSNLAEAFARSLKKENHNIIIAGTSVKAIKYDSAIKHEINPSSLIFHDALSSYKFDVVIFLSSREEQLYTEYELSSGEMLDGLKNSLNLCVDSNVDRFFLVSSTEVYGEMENRSEDITPIPASLNGHSLLSAEDYVNYYHEKFDLKTSIVRVPHVYGIYENGSLINRLILSSESYDEVVLPASDNLPLSFLHADDVVQFVFSSIIDPYTRESRIVNLSSASELSFSELEKLFKVYYPDVNYKFDDRNIIYTRPVFVDTAKRIFDWISESTLKSELENLITALLPQQASKKFSLATIGKFIGEYRSTFKWIELIGGALVMQLFIELTGTYLQFKFIDFRLLYVIIIGSVYGVRFGLMASIFASLSVLFSWYRLSFDWNLLIYNVENWLPFAIYFSTGAFTGYTQDKKNNEVEYQIQQTKLIHEKYTFLYGVYSQINRIKDQFRDQLMNYRDSFGRIYSVATELDTLREDEIFFRALGILEEIMSNDTVALYSTDNLSKFYRLEANSIPLRHKIAKSLNLDEYPILVKKINAGEIFINTEILPNYPAYCNPIINDGKVVSLVIIWVAKFEQFSTYYLNLLKVICGFIQSSLVRAVLFTDFMKDQNYIPGTNILQSEAFLEVLIIKNAMKENEIADFQLVEISNGKHSKYEMEDAIKKVIRTSDYYGTSENGKYYLLLSQADKYSLNRIIDRLNNVGIEGKSITPESILT